MRASAIVGSCIFPSSLPRSVSRQLMSPSLEKSTRETPSSPPEATPRPECRPEIDEAIELCSFLVWRLSYLQILLPPERTLLCESTRRRGIVSDEVRFWWSGPLLADTVEKVLSGLRTKFFSPAGAPHARRREGPHRFAQEQSRIFVPALQRLTATEKVRNCPSRDFRSCSIFDFFNSIGTNAKCHPALKLSAYWV